MLSALIRRTIEELLIPDDLACAIISLMNNRERGRKRIDDVSERVNSFLQNVASHVRERFDLYRSAEITEQFVDAVRRLVAQDKPVAISEFGSVAYRGASPTLLSESGYTVPTSVQSWPASIICASSSNWTRPGSRTKWTVRMSGRVSAGGA